MVKKGQGEREIGKKRGRDEAAWQGCQKAAMLHGDYTRSPVNGFVCVCARDFMSASEEQRLELHPSSLA